MNKAIIMAIQSRHSEPTGEESHISTSRHSEPTGEESLANPNSHSVLDTESVNADFLITLFSRGKIPAKINTSV